MKGVLRLNRLLNRRQHILTHPQRQLVSSFSSSFSSSSSSSSSTRGAFTSSPVVAAQRSQQKPTIASWNPGDPSHQIPPKPKPTPKPNPRTADIGMDGSALNAGAGAWGAWQVESSKFTQLVVDSMRKLYPEQLADRSWDNVGLLVGNSEADAKKRAPRVMVVNDLTFQVAIDAIGQGVSVIVSYHPFIFSGLKSITNKDPQQATLLKLTQAGIAVYCPHTAVDAAPHGLNSWLADVIAGPHDSSRSVAIPCSQDVPESHSTGAGYGAIGHFVDASSSTSPAASVPLREILLRLASKLGGLRHLMVASPVGANVNSTKVRSFATCAGSGYDVLKGADVDLLVTGETSHHSALRAIQQGRTLVQVFHSNSERAYLREVLAPELGKLLREVDERAEVVVSEYDADPFKIVDVKDLD